MDVTRMRKQIHFCVYLQKHIHRLLLSGMYQHSISFLNNQVFLPLQLMAR